MNKFALKALVEKSKEPTARFCFCLIVLSFVTYTFVARNDEQDLNQKTNQKTLKSVSIVKGKYKIDTAVIWSNRNKDALILELDKEKLVEKNGKWGIPDFIKVFLDSISPGKNFNMAGAGEKWWTGDIKDMIYTRLHDNANDTMTVLSCDKPNLPDKEFAYFAIGKTMAVLSYYSGGVRLTQNIIMIKFKDTRIVDFWFDTYGGVFSEKKEILIALKRQNNC